MPKRRSIAPRACKVLWEEYTPDCGGDGPAPFALPESFPLDLLDDFQQAEVQAWWNSYAEHIVHCLKQALSCARTRSIKEEKPYPVTLQNFVVHAVVLAHLLRLHPCTEASLPDLAKALGVAQRRLYYARDAVLEQLGQAAVDAFHGKRRERVRLGEYLTGCADLLVAELIRPADKVLVLPFRAGVPMGRRFAIVQAVAALPGVACVRESLLADDRNSLTINLK